MRKKFISLLLVLGLIFCIASCSNGAPDTNASSGISTSEAASETESISSKPDKDTADLSSKSSSKPADRVESTPSVPNNAQTENSTSTPKVEHPVKSDSSDEEYLLPPVVDEFQDEYRPRYMLGNCRELSGNPLVVLLFIDDDESSWSAAEVREYTNKYINEGLKYLELKAEEWGVDLKFSVKSYSTALSDYTLKYEGTVIKDLNISGSSKDVVEQAARDMGYSSSWAMYSMFKTEYAGASDVIFLTFLNKPGISYTRCLIGPTTSEFVEHCVIFSDYLNGTPIKYMASTVAHELLHLFGAEDFYEGKREYLAYLLYPREIMLTYQETTYEHDISDFTAYTIGWIHTAPSICFNENWWK